MEPWSAACPNIAYTRACLENPGRTDSAAKRHHTNQAATGLTVSGCRQPGWYLFGVVTVISN